MKTSQAAIWYRPDMYMYILYSPKDGVSTILEMYVGPWGSGLWQESSDYKSMEDLELDVVHFTVVQNERLRKTLLAGATAFCKAST